ncbi:MAG TPA: hypothetical protein VGB54_00520 [Allosphingosinicella sp.]
MSFEIIRVFMDRDYSLDRHIATGRPVLAVRWERGAVESEEYYEITEAELARFREDEVALEAFARRVNRGELADRKFTPPPPPPPPPRPTQPPRMANFAWSQSPRWAVGRDRDTGRGLFSVPVSNGATEYLEYYRVSEDELQLFRWHPEIGTAFARCCGRREMDSRLVLAPGADRGTYSG